MAVLKQRYNLVSFRGDTCRVLIRPKAPEVFTGWTGTAIVCKSVANRVVLSTGTLDVTAEAITVTLPLGSLPASNTAEEIEGKDLQTLDGSGTRKPYAWYLALTSPSGDTRTFVWGNVYHVERG